jgi:hypothetical protein
LLSTMSTPGDSISSSSRSNVLENTSNNVDSTAAQQQQQLLQLQDILRQLSGVCYPEQLQHLQQPQQQQQQVPTTTTTFPPAAAAEASVLEEIPDTERYLSPIIIRSRTKIEDGIWCRDYMNPSNTTLQLIWKTSKPCDQLPMEEFQTEINRLARSGSRILGKRALAGIVHLQSRDWAEYVADLANANRPRGEGVVSQRGPVVNSDMFLQTGVYFPISSLIYAFQEDLFCSDSPVSCASLVDVHDVDDANKCLRGGIIEKCRVLVRPDCGIKSSSETNVLAMMELKVNKENRLYTRDMGKCVLLCCMSALDFRRHANVTQRIMIPFVLGERTNATIYVVYLEKNATFPKILEVFSSSMEDQCGKVRFMAILAVLLSKVNNWFEEVKMQSSFKSLVHRTTIILFYLLARVEIEVLRPIKMVETIQILDLIMPNVTHKKEVLGENAALMNIVQAVDMVESMMNKARMLNSRVVAHLEDPEVRWTLFCTTQTL